MSYILEALKKSEKERQRDEIPDFQTDHSSKPLRRKKQQPSSWILSGTVVLLLLCAGGLFWWQLGVGKKLQSAVADVPLISPVPPLVPESQLVENGSSQGQSGGIHSGTPILAIKKVDSELSYLDATTVIDKKAIPVKKEKPLTRDAEVLPPLMDELPASVRAAIPDLSFAGHVYSDEPLKRLIIINNRIVREGDLVVDSLFLQKIDREGVVLRYDASIFRVKLF